MIGISQLAVSIFMIYIFWFREAYGHNPIILYGTVIIATVAALVDVFTNRGKLPINKILKMFFVFGVYSFITGLFISRNQSHFISMMGTYFSFVIVCWDCFYISYKKKKIDWLMNIVILSCVFCTLQIFFGGYDYKTEVIVTTMGPENNPHTLGHTMILGIFGLISSEKKVKDRFTIKMILLIAFIFVILLSGSRKSLICVGIMFAYWVISILQTEKHFTIKKLALIFSIAILVVGGAVYFLTQYIESDMYIRLLMLFEQDGAVDARWGLYQDAFSFLKQNPLFGIGFGQYQIWSQLGIYSHSSYAEILSCTGIIGSYIFFLPLISLTWKLLKRSKSNLVRYDYSMCLIMMLIELVLGVGQIYIYTFRHLFCFTYIMMRMIELDTTRFNTVNMVFCSEGELNEH